MLHYVVLIVQNSAKSADVSSLPLCCCCSAPAIAAVNVQEEFMTNFRLWLKEASRPFQLFAGALTACKSVTKEVTYRGMEGS